MIEAGPLRVRTRLELTIERLTTETGRSAAAILAHTGRCDYYRRLLTVCDRFLFDGDSIHWDLNSMWLVQGIGELDRPCYECEPSCPNYLRLWTNGKIGRDGLAKIPVGPAGKAGVD